MQAPIYLDHAATTPLDPLVRATLHAALEDFGNPSSRHRFGQRAAERLEAARRELARVLGAPSAGVVFTSGGTEANNLGVIGAARARSRRGKHVVIGPTEHASVRAAARALATEGFEVEGARLAPDGSLDLADLAARLRPDTVLVAQMLVQNEFGSVYPVARVARLVRARSPHAALHVDAVQALGKLELSLPALGADSLAVCAHKVHGPRGAGALALAAAPRPQTLAPLSFGGGQEHGARAGTENVPAIAAFAHAARLAEERRERTHAHLSSLRARFAAGLARVEGARLFAPGATAEPCSPSIASVLLAGLSAEVGMHHLEERGVLAGAGSACQSRKQELSPALLALGLSAEEARSVLRFSFSHETTEGEIDAALEALEATCRTLASARR